MPSSPSHLRPTEHLLSTPPQHHQERSTHLLLDYAIAPCFLGFILVAATPNGICRIDIDNQPEVLLTRLEQNFPNAILQKENHESTSLIADVLACLKQPARNSGHLPLDIKGTSFQKQVWQALQAIPAGQTTTYSKLAQQLGKPKAFRAVATACAANPLAIVIPCHRVIAKNGDLRGYRWGIERKQALLQQEANQANPIL